MTHPEADNELYLSFVRTFTRHEAALRTFVRSLLPGWDDVDEVMQEVSVVVWKRFDTFDPDTEFMRWAAVIARFEVLNYRRRKARDKHIFDEDVIALLANECLEKSERQVVEQKALRHCLAKLPDHQRQLMLRAYSPQDSIKSIADEIGKTPTAVYKVLGRLRFKLYECIERSLKQERLA